VVVGDTAVVCFGRADKGTPRLHGVKLGGSGDVTKTNHLWARDQVSSFVPSPVEFQGRVYLLGDRGNVACIDPATGKTIWNETLPRSSSNFYASPLIADGTMFMAREDGALFVARVDGGFKLLGEGKLNDRVIASPIAVGNRLFIRGEANLYCWAGE
jgi:outer membrane protein assembly factor BamB